MTVKMQKLVSTLLALLLLVIAIPGCKNESRSTAAGASLILHNAYVYPVTGEPIEAGAVAVRDGKIAAIGASEGILKTWKSDATELIDCQGQFLMPGFIEGHGHFHSLGKMLIQLDLLESKNWNEIVDSVRVAALRAKPGDWIIGRGWHQEKWNEPVTPSVNGYPYHDMLSAVSPDNPVMLTHASGHAVMANAKAMELAGITAESGNPDGGVILRDNQKVITGVLEENALNLVEDLHDAYIESLSMEEQDRLWTAAMNKVQSHCLQYGITSFHDAGSTFEEIARYRKMVDNDSLALRLYVMIYEKLDSLQGRLDGFPVVGEGNNFFTCRAIKTYYDGALGSYGALLLAPYNDLPASKGQVTTKPEEIHALADLCIDNGMQIAVHAIGDKANRNVLDMYESVMQKHPEKKDLRWRIEHAQHIDPQDIPRFKPLGVIASMQAIHCTSDSPFVVKRLGEERARTGAYPWRSLLDAGAIVCNGTDAPVEKVDPIANFYASVTRKRPGGDESFFPEQSMTREEALYSMTMANAYAAFEETMKGSIEVGKMADLVLLDKNLMEIDMDSVLQAKSVMTIINGKIRYRSAH
jgi:predicted amidohydrolase YtcJ